jgi:hypothetical protein
MVTARPRRPPLDYRTRRRNPNHYLGRRRAERHRTGKYQSYQSLKNHNTLLFSDRIAIFRLAAHEPRNRAGALTGARQWPSEQPVLVSPPQSGARHQSDAIHESTRQLRNTWRTPYSRQRRDRKNVKKKQLAADECR